MRTEAKAKERAADQQLFHTLGLAVVGCVSVVSLIFSIMAWSNSRPAGPDAGPVAEPVHSNDQAVAEVNRVRTEFENYRREYEQQQAYMRQLQVKVDGIDNGLGQIRTQVGDVRATHGETPVEPAPQNLPEGQPQ
ncbi:MAG: hypothetical protein M5U26_28530 [Planctomycetota bacterium]|nr:hypothetical protein [Planctomycetota bacterium]